ncbi:MAG: ABC transporter ATP-binding protein [Candidatus Saccharimonadales bacterium]
MAKHKDVVITVDNVSKDFVLPHQKVNSLKGLFTGMLQPRGEKESQHALRNINIEIEHGEFFGIVGRNGSGKSTLLKLLAGIYQPTKGKVITRGKLVPFIELGVGFNPELTGRENVFLNGAMLGFSRKEITKMYDSIVEFAEIERFMDQKLKNYSSGMQVRLAFSMAVRAEADILLIDEVLAVGDADFQRKCFAYFKKLKRDGKTVVFVSHDMNAVREYCDRAVMIEKSRIIAEASADAIATKYTRMFIEQAKSKTETSQTSSDKRWGSGQLKYSKLKVSVSDASITIAATALAHKTVENVNLGFSVSDSSGQKLLGTNSQTKKQKITKLEAKQSINLTWQFANVLKDGDYFINLAAVSIGGDVWDWWDEAIFFKVTKEESSPYIINPTIEVKIKL